MTYHIFRLLALLVPGAARRQRFIDWARSRYDLRTMISTALAAHLAAVQSAVYYHAHLFETRTVMTIDETLDDLIDGGSIARFGDGELLSIDQKWNAFQKPDATLAARLAEVLSSDEPGLSIGIYRHNYRLSDELNKVERGFYINDAFWMQRVQERYLRSNKTYAATEVSMAHTIYRGSFDRQAYFEKLRRIWQGAKVTLIHGEGIFDGFAHDIFDNAASVDHILAPRQDAFDHYDDILRQALQAPKDNLVLAILGPTATVLAYDLHRAGYRVLDLGHIAKSYDWWLRGRFTDEQASNDEFFAAD